METALQKLSKILELERKGGFRNKAVINGIEAYIPLWIEDARDQATTETAKVLVEQIGELLMDYGRLGGPSARAKLIGPIQERLNKAIEAAQSASPSAPPPPAAEPAAKPRTEAELASRAAEESPSAESLPPVQEVATPRETPTELPAGLQASVDSVRGIGPRTSTLLHKLGIETIQDLVTFYPRRYVDFATLKPINRLEYGEQVTIIGTVWSTSTSRVRQNLTITRAVISDGTATIQCTWFNQPHLTKKLTTGLSVMVSGTVDRHLGKQVFNSPEWEPVDKEQLHTGRIVPVYPLTAGLTSKMMRTHIKRSVDYWARRIPDHIPEDIRRRQKLMNLETALSKIHFPDSDPQLEDARRRLAFDELFLLQMGMLRLRQKWQAQPGVPLAVSDEWLAEFLSRLPYELTGAQKQTLREIRQGMANPVPMNRLLQGDVGSGKTVVATAALAAAVKAGAQAALMAPTEILAEQHAAKIQQMVPETNVRLLTGSLSAGDKETIYEELADGRAEIVVGTHALIQTGVNFANLGLVVIDEQHRFGVEQRGALRQKGYHPHMLVMTATPIPRTLALTLYGDLDLAVIDEMPPGRQEIATYVVPAVARERAYNLIRKEVNAGRQAFIICPLVEDSGNNEAKSAVGEHKRLQTKVFPEFKLGLMHGRLSGEAKEAAMQAFYQRETQVLVSTSVVEVGIDVPNATVMLVEGANRFGLAQLHQFRGRVGRGEHQSYCLLLADSETAESNERLAALEASNDGFVLAEKDLELRGPGEFFGTRQSGMPDLKMAQVTDLAMLQKARTEAADLFQRDPNLEGTEVHLLAAKLQEFWAGRGDVS